MAKKKTKKQQGIFGKKGFLSSGLSKLILLVVFAVGIGYSGVKLMNLSFATAFADVGEHPQAIQQGGGGQYIRTLESWNGKIYAGFGDYGANTGPIALTPYDPVTSTFASAPEFSADTEQIANFLKVNNKIYAPAVDTKWGADFTVGELVNGSTKWASGSGAGMVHAFDMATLNGTDLYIAGSKSMSDGDHGVVYRSTDGGATWQVSLDFRSADPTKDVTRFYMVARYQNKLYVQPLEYSSSATYLTWSPQKSWIFDGTRWSRGPTFNTMSPEKGREFAGKLVMKSDDMVSNLLAFNGRSTSAVLSNTADYTVDTDGYLYALHFTNSNNEMMVSRTKDLVSWQALGQASNRARSITTLGNEIFLGTYDGHLLRGSKDLDQKDTTAPTVKLLYPSQGGTIMANTWLQADASDAGDIKKVEYYVDDKLVGYTSNIVRNHTGIPENYAVKWNGYLATAGPHTLTVMAYDTYGNTSQQSIDVTVDPSGVTPDTTAPTLSISSPNDGYKARKSVRIYGSASDNGVGLKQYAVYYDGVVIKQEDFTSTTYSKYIDVTQPVSTRGTHTIVIEAVDVAGNKTSTTRTIKK